MTNEQLQMLLCGWIDELDAAIDGARNAMPEGAEREESQEWRLKPEYADSPFAWVAAAGNVDMREVRTVYGEYIALVPLVALRDAWQERINMLVKGSDE